MSSTRTIPGAVRVFAATVVALLIATPLAAQWPEARSWPQYFDGVQSMGPWQWAAINGTTVAAGVIGGVEPPNNLYVCRAFIETGWQPGKLVGSTCHVGFQGAARAITTGAQVLTNTRSDLAQYFPAVWNPASFDSAMSFRSVSPSATPMRICRGYANGAWHPGRESNNGCSIAVAQNEVVVPQYEVMALYNGLKMEAAITKQIVPVKLSDPVLLELVTIVNYPGTLQQGALLAPNNEFRLMRMETDDSSCPNVPGTSCRQRHRWWLSVGRNCQLNGEWKAMFLKQCAGTTACGAGEQTVALTLASENFCAYTGQP